ncbi:MAG TPA: aldose 1-epimerase family protein [Pirellulales bacterium]
MAEKNWTLIDNGSSSKNSDFALTAAELGIAGHDFHVRQSRLRGGLREGVESVEIDNGRFSFVVLPTRGMGIWKGWLGKRGQPGTVEVGWQSPVDGPVHPQFVSLADPSGLGFLDGFDEWIVRCGLESNGAPEFDDRGVLKYPLHGRIANRPASKVELTFDDQQQEIRLTGIVEETRFLFRRLRLRTTISTRLGEPGLRIHDEVTNVGAMPQEAQLLYHINFGPPLLEAGSRCVAPVAQLVPRDRRAAEGIDDWALYPGPEAGYAEKVYFADLVAGTDHRTHVLLENAAKTLGASVGFDKRQLPHFMLWKNTGAVADGYVTGLEPSTNFPNPRSFEGARGRVVKLAPGETASFDVSLTIHADRASVAAAEQAVAAVAAGCTPHVFQTPQRNWSVAGTKS